MDEATRDAAGSAGGGDNTREVDFDNATSSLRDTLSEAGEWAGIIKKLTLIGIEGLSEEGNPESPQMTANDALHAIRAMATAIQDRAESAVDVFDNARDDEKVDRLLYELGPSSAGPKAATS